MSASLDGAKMRFGLLDLALPNQFIDFCKPVHIKKP